MKIRLFVILTSIAILTGGCVFGRAARRMVGGGDAAPTAAQTALPTAAAARTTMPEQPAPTVTPGATRPVPTIPAATLAVEAETRRDVQYYAQSPGKNPRSTSLDIYTPGGSGNPIMVYVHGGGWTNGDKGNVQEKPEAFNTAGYVFISLNYRMIPEVDVVAEAQDIARAVAWIYTHAAEFGGDAGRIFLMGHSAGCHLVSLVGTDGSYLEAAGLSLSVIKGVVALDTQAYDVTTLMQEQGRVGVYHDAFGDDPETWKKLSPITYVAAGRGIPPFIVAYSNQGGERRAQAAENFIKALQDAGITAQLLPATDKTHAAINQEIGEPGDFVTEAILEFLERLL